MKCTYPSRPAITLRADGKDEVRPTPDKQLTSKALITESMKVKHI